ncbi:MAG TPA: pitrilysin family protein [Thermoanaerobaculia bacterium]|nr:pitrilysin family protein [Thermoanaerobaculia bacterium]
MKRTLLSLLLATTVFAQTKQAPPAPGTPRDFAIPEIRRMELPNGLRVRLVPFGAVPKATVRVVTQTGNVDEGANEVWLADLTGELLEQGTTTRTSAQIAREAALMGGSLDISVGQNQTNIVMDVFSESAAAAVALAADVLRNPRLPESEVARLKADLARNLSLQTSQSQSIAAAKFASVMFPDHPYGRYFPTEAMLQAYTIDQARAFHARNFGAARTFVYVVGRFDAAAVESAIRTSFGDWKRGEAPAKVTVSPVRKRGLYFVERPGAVQSTVIIGLPTINAADPEYLPLTVMNSLLAGSFGSRITSNIREQKGYTYSPFGAVSTRLGAATWAETADVTTNVTGASIKEILGEVERLRNEAPPAAELRGIQNYVAGTFVLPNSSRGGIAGQLAFLDLYGLSEEYLRTLVQKVYALTPADIQRLAKTYLDPASMSIVVVGDPSVQEQIKAYQ